MTKINWLVGTVLLSMVPAVSPAQDDGVELVYREDEAEVDPYFVKVNIAGDRMRIDDLSDDSGYIIYDHGERRIYSVSNFDRSTLVIDLNEAELPQRDSAIVVTETELRDAPKISGRIVHDYRVSHAAGDKQDLCTHIQYVPGLLPEIGEVLQGYQQLISMNQLRSLDQLPEEFRTPCMIADKVTNMGEYYARGLVISEWHESGKRRLLQDYRQVTVDEEALFDVPEDYRQFGIGDQR